MTKQLTSADVKKHRGQKSAWIIIHNDIYDVTKFLKEHPGGPEALLDVAGKDGTQAFEDVGHSKDAREMMKQYKIGTLPVGEQTKFIDTCSKWKWALLALAGALIIGFVLKKYVAK